MLITVRNGTAEIRLTDDPSSSPFYVYEGSSRSVTFLVGDNTAIRAETLAETSEPAAESEAAGTVADSTPDSDSAAAEPEPVETAVQPEPATTQPQATPEPVAASAQFGAEAGTTAPASDSLGAEPTPTQVDQAEQQEQATTTDRPA